MEQAQNVHVSSLQSVAHEWKDHFLHDMSRHRTWSRGGTCGGEATALTSLEGREIGLGVVLKESRGCSELSLTWDVGEVCGTLMMDCKLSMTEI